VKTASEKTREPLPEQIARISTASRARTALRPSEGPIMMRLRRQTGVEAIHGAIHGANDPALDAQQHVSAPRASTMNVMPKQDNPSAMSDRGVKLADRFGELVRDGRRDGGARRDNDADTPAAHLPMTKVTAICLSEARRARGPASRRHDADPGKREHD